MRATLGRLRGRQRSSCEVRLLPDEADAELDRPRSHIAPGLRAALLPLLRNNGPKN